MKKEMISMKLVVRLRYQNNMNKIWSYELLQILPVKIFVNINFIQPVTPTNTLYEVD